MSKTGQSFGKRIMKIKVINLDGRNPGFVGTVQIREILFQTIFGIFSYLLIKIFNLNPESTEKICNYLITFICFLCCSKRRPIVVLSKIIWPKQLS